MIWFCNIVFSDPGMLPIYLLTGTYFLRENQIHLNCSSFLHQIDEQKLC